MWRANPRSTQCQSAAIKVQNKNHQCPHVQLWHRQPRLTWCHLPPSAQDAPKRRRGDGALGHFLHSPFPEGREQFLSFREVLSIHVRFLPSAGASPICRRNPSSSWKSLLQFLSPPTPFVPRWLLGASPCSRLGRRTHSAERAHRVFQCFWMRSGMAMFSKLKSSKITLRDTSRGRTVAMSDETRSNSSISARAHSRAWFRAKHWSRKRQRSSH